MERTKYQLLDEFATMDPEKSFDFCTNITCTTCRRIFYSDKIGLDKYSDLCSGCSNRTLLQQRCKDLLKEYWSFSIDAEEKQIILNQDI